ncbi:MAG: ATP-binding protein [Flammeovirgaceae bacterium]|nr:ATP-binding protein [Flammeovirgaceae bacterium]MDW8287925.1 AAA family ATPase [Flammeovirgaceae bacterium]
MQELPRLPVGEQDFEKIRRSGMVYVDKTGFIYRMINSGVSFYFVSRPRRFGKSLLVSTLKEIFLGKRELFEGLYIYDKISWESFPVIHIDFSNIGFRDIGLVEAIDRNINQWASFYEVSLQARGIGLKFSELIQKLYVKSGRGVVILIDEYDKPLTDVLESHEMSRVREHREVLRNFYSVVKGNSGCIRFFFLTGITRFTKVSLFSDLNNLTDLTFFSDFHGMLGYTQEEIRLYFRGHIEWLSCHQGRDYEAVLKEIREWYDGYSWNGRDRVYNPYSVLRFLFQGEFQNFWFESGTPKFLIGQLKEKMRYDLSEVSVNMGIINNFDINDLNLETLLFQTGYLTIVRKDEIGGFVLGYPNKEVEQSMLQYLITAFSDNSLSSRIAEDIALSVRQGDMGLFVETLNRLFSGIAGEIFLSKKEAYYHSVVYLALKLSGYHVGCEVRTSRGRIDAVMWYGGCCYVFEFKLDDSVENAIKQIREKRYYEPFVGRGHRIFLVGINFSSERKEVDGWLMEELVTDS